MSYSISYDSGNMKKYAPQQKSRRYLPVLLLILALAVIGGYFRLAEGQAPLLSFLLPGADASTGEAIGAMLDDIRAGEHVSQAVTAFCMEIIRHAG